MAPQQVGPMLGVIVLPAGVAGLLSDVEQIGLMRQPAVVLHQEEMARRRHGEKLRNTFDDPEDDNCKPVRHAWVRREITGSDKRQMVETHAVTRWERGRTLFDGETIRLSAIVVLGDLSG